MSVQEGDHSLPAELEDSVFESREDALQALRAAAIRQGFALKIKASKANGKTYLECAASGKSRSKLHIEKEPLVKVVDNEEVSEQTYTDAFRKNTRSQLVECPYRCYISSHLRKTQAPSDDAVTDDSAEPVVERIYQIHLPESGTIEAEHQNHICSTTAVKDFAIARRLNPQQESLIKASTSAYLNPANVQLLLDAQRKAAPSSTDTTLLPTITDIKNFQKADRMQRLNGRTHIENLKDELVTNQIPHTFRCDGEGRITHFIFSFPSQIKMGAAHSYVLQMDCTYKTNRSVWSFLRNPTLTNH